MRLTRLKLSNFRNLTALDLKPCSNFNIIYGLNGSGKTSLLEAISYLGYGRSFRTSKFQPLIQDEQDYFAINVNVDDDSSSIATNIGLLRNRKKNLPIEIKINDKANCKLVDVVDRVSVLTIHPQSISLVLEGPEERRNYLDWGCYYLEPSFKSLWSQYKKILSQRNTLLKNKAPLEQIQIWDPLYVKLCEEITNFRKKYLTQIIPFLLENLRNFLPNFDFEFHFSQGWDNGLELGKALALNIEKDRVLGYTLYGCHRAELKIKCNGLYASETLSRGQLKLLVCAMKLAQGNLLKQAQNKKCIYLIDDISSELDDNSMSLLLNSLTSGDNQVFMTNISKHVEIPTSVESEYLDIAKSIIS